MYSLCVVIMNKAVVIKCVAMTKYGDVDHNTGDEDTKMYPLIMALTWRNNNHRHRPIKRGVPIESWQLDGKDPPTDPA